MTKIENIIREMMKDPNVNLESLGQDIARTLNTIQEEERKKKEEQEQKKIEEKNRLDDLRQQHNQYVISYSKCNPSTLNLEDAAHIAAVALDNTIALSQNPQWNANKMAAAKSVILKILKYITEHPSFAMLGSAKIEDWNDAVRDFLGVKVDYSLIDKEMDKFMKEWKRLSAMGII